MKAYVSLLVAAALVGAAAPASAQSKAKAQNVPEITYDSVTGTGSRPATPVSRSSTRTGTSSSRGDRAAANRASFDSIRGIVLDAQGNVYVADAGNKRIQVFDGDGNVKSQITNVGVPSALCITQGAYQYLFSSNSNDLETLDDGWTAGLWAGSDGPAAS
jgi:hypothetical protein